ncbi:nucleotide sugar dehydrogenase [Parasutterella secunda]|uniref:nucleotide sugar dehydrogenase n=1 Tax=Parasutterella secunda TaxID=626947 RepID=UPI002012A149|nr:nucleotide sugar dehydrogenase [Parasutterella secunda]MCL1596431.1 nucleotide sugar dehydrogenase [Parasutterella secunda]
MKIAVVGIGYVGLSNAILLAQHNEVVLVDVIKEKVELINNKKSPIVDALISNYLKNKPLNLRATLNLDEACKGAEFILIATPTDYDDKTNRFNTLSVESVLQQASVVNPSATIIIKSTIPVGFTEGIRLKGFKNVIFVPEFLREGQALYDNLYPSRIVIGDKSEKAKHFGELMLQGAIKKDTPVLYTNSTEAEAIKLFANTYLAMRVAFFNELDSYAWKKGLNSQEIIEGIGLDPRIGSHYCNPSFGYGGYCLPKDTKQLLANYKDVPQELISAIVRSNKTRKHLVASQVLAKSPKVVGVYKLAMKTGSDNCRASAIFDIINEIKSKGIQVIVYDPAYSQNNSLSFLQFEDDLAKFKEISDVIITNRYSQDLKDVETKVFSRDLFRNN